MKVYFAAFLCLFAIVARAGRSYTLQATRGDLTISSISTSPELKAGDTLYIPSDGSYTSVQYRHLKGDSANKIYIIWLPGSQVKSPSYFQQISSFNISHVVIENMRHFNFYGSHKFSYGIHDVVFKNCQWINPAGSYKDQPPLQWDDQYSPVSMVFKGRKTQTFYNVRYEGCMFDGFKNVNVIQISTNWNNSNNEINRSLALDFEFASDTFQNITSTYPITVGAISGTGFNCKVRNCIFKNILGPGSVQKSHSASILWYGTIDVNHCLQENSYAQLLRCVPRGWVGLPGYLDKNTACRAWRNIIHNNLSYSPFEFNQDIGGYRNEQYGFRQVKALCLYNTVYRTRRGSYNGPYYGFVADNANQDTLECSYNVIVAPEYDYPFDANRNYIVATISNPSKHQTMVGNKVFKTWTKNIFLDTVHYTPGEAVLLNAPAKTNYAYITTDFSGKRLPENGPAYAGAVEGENAGVKKIKKK